MQQNNKENRSFKIITAIALCVAVLCLSVAYAALSQSLKIDGTATVEHADWNIDGPGNTTLTEKSPGGSSSGTDSHMTGEVTDNGEGVIAVAITAHLKKPGDYAEIEIPVTNNGDVDAHLSSVTGTSSEINCDDESNLVDADKTIVCENGGDGSPAVVYTVSYNDQAVNTDDWENSIKGTARDLAKDGVGQAKIKIRAEYRWAATKIPSAAVKVTLPEFTFAFQQGKAPTA